MENEEEVAGGGCGANEGARGGGGSCGWRASAQTETNRGSNGGANEDERRLTEARAKTNGGANRCERRSASIFYYILLKLINVPMQFLMNC